MQKTNIPTSRNVRAWLTVILVITGVLAGCENKQETGQTLAEPAPSPVPFPSDQSPVVQPAPTQFKLGPLFESDIDLWEGPVPLPLELQIPALNVTAPMLGVGLTAGNAMDSPKGSIGDPIWGSAFWYRGSSIPGEPGVATIAGHVNDPLGRAEIFSDLEDLKPGDLIIVHLKNTTMDIHFFVDQVKVYSTQESSDPLVLTNIYGAGPVNGTAPQPSLDGLAHLTLITCAGYIINGEFDHHTVVFATRTD